MAPLGVTKPFFGQSGGGSGAGFAKRMQASQSECRLRKANAGFAKRMPFFP